MNNNTLSNNWNLWFHSPFENDWSINSYKQIFSFSTLEDCIRIVENIHHEIYEKYMVFFMKNDIKPIWEDENNKFGGCFSYKILSSEIYEYSKIFIYLIIGNTLLDNKEVLNNITGISISPKKNFCIFKIWIKDTEVINKYINKELENNVEIDDIFNLHSFINTEKLNTIFKLHKTLY